MDHFESPDYYQLDDLLTEEYKLIREATRSWVKKAVSPIIEDAAQRAIFPKEQRATTAKPSSSLRA